MDIPASQLGGGAAIARNLQHPGHSLTKAHEDDLFSVWSTGWKVVILSVGNLFQFTRIKIKAPQILRIVGEISRQDRDIARATGSDGIVQVVLAEQGNAVASVRSRYVSVS